MQVGNWASSRRVQVFVKMDSLPRRKVQIFSARSAPRGRTRKALGAEFLSSRRPQTLPLYWEQMKKEAVGCYVVNAA